MKNALQKIWNRWQEFWFAPRDLFNVAVFRAVTTTVMFFMYLVRFLDVEDFYFNNGLLPSNYSLKLFETVYESPFPVFFTSDAANYWGHVVFLVGLALLALGLIGRSLTWVVWVLHLGFLQRNFAVVYGADLFANFWLLYLCFIDHNRHMNIWHLWRPKRPLLVPDQASDILSAAFTRLLQIQLCVSYAYTGIEKLKGVQWWEGTAFWYTLGMRELVANDLTFLREMPIAVGLLSMGPILFEIYFPFGVMDRRLRPWWLLFGLMFHIAIGLVMGLWFFAMVMISAYIVFLDSTRLRQFVGFIAFRLGILGKKSPS